MIFSMPDTAIEQTVMVFIVNDMREILLARRLNTWFGENQFAPPGGLVDAGETPKAAAVREVVEEVGLTVHSLSLLETGTTTGSGRVFQNYYFVTYDFSGIPVNTEPARHSEIGWHPLSHLPTDTMPLVRGIVERHLL